MDNHAFRDFSPNKSIWGEVRPDGTAPWSILSAVEWRVMDKVLSRGVPLREWEVLVNYGVKTGYNAAFIIDEVTRASLIAEDPQSADILRPILRGRDVQRYRAQWARIYLIDTHNGYRDTPAIDVDDYPAIKNYLNQFSQSLRRRYD